MFVANAQVSGDIMMCRWGVAEDRTVRKKRIKRTLIVHRDFMQGLFYQILAWGGGKWPQLMMNL